MDRFSRLSGLPKHNVLHRRCTAVAGFTNLYMAEKRLKQSLANVSAIVS
jgi:hypothetical protein